MFLEVLKGPYTQFQPLLATVHKSTFGWVDRENVVCTYNGILLSNEKECVVAICDKMNETYPK